MGHGSTPIYIATIFWRINVNKDPLWPLWDLWGTIRVRCVFWPDPKKNGRATNRMIHLGTGNPWVFRGDMIPFYGLKRP